MRQLTADIIELARQYGRYGYRPITAQLNQAGWHVNSERVERIWRREALKAPQKQKNARARNEFLDGEVFYPLREARLLIERWRRHSNTVRPHNALGLQASGVG